MTKVDFVKKINARELPVWAELLMNGDEFDYKFFIDSDDFSIDAKIKLAISPDGLILLANGEWLRQNYAWTEKPKKFKTYLDFAGHIPIDNSKDEIIEAIAKLIAEIWDLSHYTPSCCQK